MVKKFSCEVEHSVISYNNGVRLKTQSNKKSTPTMVKKNSFQKTKPKISFLIYVQHDFANYTLFYFHKNKNRKILFLFLKKKENINQTKYSKYKHAITYIERKKLLSYLSLKKIN
jgi:hypothetical protein